MIVTCMCLALAAPPDATAPPAPDLADVVRVSATMPATLAVDVELELQVTVELAPGWSASAAGIPKPFLQIDVPPGAVLAGAVLRDHRELARNEFLKAPYERLLEIGPNAVGFTLRGEPAGGFGLNVIAYVSRPGSEDAYFVRRRLHLPLRPGAAAEPADAAVSDWGDATSGLQIGAPAAPFALPRADGTTVSLSDALQAGKHVIVTTYRAFW